MGPGLYTNESWYLINQKGAEAEAGMISKAMFYDTVGFGCEWVMNCLLNEQKKKKHFFCNK